MIVVSLPIITSSRVAGNALKYTDNIYKIYQWRTQDLQMRWGRVRSKTLMSKTFKLSLLDLFTCLRIHDISFNILNNF